MNELQEIYQLSNAEIVKITSYLDDIEPKLTIKQRKFAYFYILNNMNGVEAAKYAGYKVHKGKNEYMHCQVIASQNLNKLIIIEAIEKIANKIIKNRKALEQRLFDIWFSQATYDPSIFFNPDGELKFKTWEEIPEKYRCCIEGMEIKYYGKDAQRKIIALKLVDKKFAQDKLDKYIQMTKDTSKTEIEMSDETVTKLQNIFNRNVKKDK